jgi:membrane protein YdbS with pleckstrin-like domain
MNPKPLVERIAGAQRWRAVGSCFIRLTFALSLGFVSLWCLTNIQPWFIGLAASFAVIVVMTIMAAPIGKYAYWLETARPRDRVARKTAVTPG